MCVTCMYEREFSKECAGLKNETKRGRFLYDTVPYELGKLLQKGTGPL